MKLIKEFKEFAIKGNMFDMAIGILVGASFSKIVSSFVEDIIMPPFGYLIGGVNFRNLKIVFQKEIIDPSGEVVQEMVALNYGNFTQVIFDFAIVAFTIFIVIKVFNTMRKRAEDVDDTTEPTPKNIELLSEIRDILKQGNNK